MPSVDISSGSGKTASVADSVCRIQNEREEIACERKNHLSNSKIGQLYQVSKTDTMSRCAPEICWLAGHLATTESSQDPSSLPLRLSASISRTTLQKRRTRLINLARRVTNTRRGVRKRGAEPRREPDSLEDGRKRLSRRAEDNLIERA